MAADDPNELARRLSEQAIALSEQARFPEMNPGPVIRTETDGAIILANAAARDVFGADLIGRRWQEVCPCFSTTSWNDVLASDGIVDLDARVGNRDFVFAHRHDPEGHLVFIYGTDISRQKQAEHDAAEQARFPEMNPGPVVRTDLEGTMVLANAAARALFGEDLVGRRWREQVPGADDAMWDRVLRGTEPIYLEAQLNERDYVFAHRRDHDGSLVFIFGADVTQQKAAERALRQSEKMATLGTLAAGVAHELNNPAAATRRSAEQMLEAFSRLENAHAELAEAGIGSGGREHLRGIAASAREAAGRTSALGSVERSDRESEVEEWLEGHGIEDGWELAPALVAQGLDPEGLAALSAAVGSEATNAAVRWAASAFPVYSLLRDIGEGSSRISELVGALKSYSYLGQAPVQDVDLHEGIDNTLVILRHKLKQGVEVERDYSAELPRVPAFGSELNQVWTNLLDNAIDAMDGQGKITVRTRLEDPWAIVEITDSGPGVPADIQSRIFDPFFTTKAPGQGTGLGLSTTFSIIQEKHHGRIELDSAPGRTTFRVRLPLSALANG
jgi:signal transduction histidine kinase